MDLSCFYNMNKQFLKEQVVIITGASKGIGKDTALLMAQLGAKVVVNYSKSHAKAEETVKEINEKGGQSYAYKADVSNFNEVKAMAKAIVLKFGKVDILVNNAGITDPRFFLEITENDWNNMMSINLKGVFNCCRLIVPHMIKRKQGRIINISSVVAKSGAIGAGVHYCAAKAGVIGFTKALANQLANYNITANAVAPAMIDTEMISWRTEDQLKEHLDLVPMKRLGSCRETSMAIAFLASRYASYITGATIDINGGLYMD